MEIITILLSALTALITSLITAYATTRLNIRRERKKWERDLAQRLAELGRDDGAKADRLARQFAVGYLVFTRPEMSYREKAFIPPAGRLSIGRADDNDVVIQDSSISRHHAVFEAIDSDVCVIDLGSTCGVYVNQGPIGAQKVKLKDGDEIQVGGIPFVFHTM